MGVVLVKIQLSERVYHELKTAMQHLYPTSFYMQVASVRVSLPYSFQTTHLSSLFLKEDSDVFVQVVCLLKKIGYARIGKVLRGPSD